MLKTTNGQSLGPENSPVTSEYSLQEQCFWASTVALEVHAESGIRVQLTSVQKNLTAAQRTKGHIAFKYLSFLTLPLLSLVCIGLWIQIKRFYVRLKASFWNKSLQWKQNHYSMFSHNIETVWTLLKQMKSFFLFNKLPRESWCRENIHF